MNKPSNRALVLLSGGQDSATCLYWAIDRFGADQVWAISFDYGQRHRIELESAARIADKAGIDHTCLPIDTFTALGGDALTDASVDVAAGVDENAGLPSTFVPGRNLIFLTYAAAFAWRRDIGILVTGVAQTDYSGYPDCREETMDALQQALRLGMESEMTILAPLMELSKKQTVEMARELGCLDALVLTHTCYKGKRPPCGECAACKLRAKGFAEAGVEDPLITSQ